MIKIKVVVLAAGYATRLYPLTENKAKSLLPINGKPLIEYIIDKIVEIKSIEEIIIVSNEKFFEDFQSWSNKFDSKIPIKILNDGSTTDENKLGAIKDIQFAIKEESINDAVIVLAGDNLFEFSLNEFINFCKGKQGAGTATTDTGDVEIVRNRHGVVIIGNGDRITGFQEKPAEPKSTVKSVACYFFPKSTLGLLNEYIDGGNNTDATGFFLEWLCNKTNVYAFGVKTPIYDIGNTENYNNVNEIYSKGDKN